MQNLAAQLPSSYIYIYICPSIFPMKSGLGNWLKVDHKVPLHLPCHHRLCCLLLDQPQYSQGCALEQPGVWFDSCQGKRPCSLQIFHWLFPSQSMHKHGRKHRSKWLKWFEDALCIWAIGISTLGSALAKTGIYLRAYLASLDGPLVSYDAYAAYACLCQV